MFVKSQNEISEQVINWQVMLYSQSARLIRHRLFMRVAYLQVAY